MKELDANLVYKVAERIGQCDFRSEVSRYATSGIAPWTIIVGESHWQRLLVVKDVTRATSNEEIDAVLDIIDGDSHLDRVERTITLKELTAGHFGNMKRILNPLD